jgi:hypothetical protein
LEDHVDSVRLPDLETIRRFSIAVRSEHAPAEDVIEALRADLDRIERAIGRRRAPAARTSVPASKSRSSARKPRR